jgi:hypothetical protein
LPQSVSDDAETNQRALILKGGLQFRDDAFQREKDHAVSLMY